MKRYARLLATYILIAVAVVVLYAPWGLALRPWDFDILRAGMSIIAGVALAGVFGTSTYFALKEPDQKLLQAADVVSAEEVIPVLREYVEAPYVGGIAADAIDQVQSATRKRERLRKAIGAQFSEGSLTWDRFASLVDQAEQTVVRNAALIANGVQTFDCDEYKKDLADVRRAHKNDAVDVGIQRKQVAVHERSLDHMREVLEANERVLLEMGKLELELSRLEEGDTLEDNNQTVGDLQTLIDETRYYR